MATKDSAEVLRDVTRDVYRELRQNVDADVRLEQGEPIAGEKAEPITVGLIVLTLISSGAAAGIVESMRKAFKRDSSLKVKVTRPGGQMVEVTAMNISRRSTQDALERLLSEAGV